MNNTANQEKIRIQRLWIRVTKVAATIAAICVFFHITGIPLYEKLSKKEAKEIKASDFLGEWEQSYDKPYIEKDYGDYKIRSERQLNIKFFDENKYSFSGTEKLSYWDKNDTPKYGSGSYIVRKIEAAGLFWVENGRIIYKSNKKPSCEVTKYGNSIIEKKVKLSDSFPSFDEQRILPESGVKLILTEGFKYFKKEKK